MVKRNFSNKCRMGILRDGKRVYFTFEFKSEYEAMEAFDVWKMEDIDITFKGPKEVREMEEVKDGK